MDEFKKGWGALLAATFGTMCGLVTVTNYSQGFLVGPVTAEFGWSTPQFFLGFTVMMCMGLICAPIVGSLAGKYGVRLLGIVGLIGHALSYVIISFNPGSLPLWYLSFALLAILGAGSLPVIWTTILNDYFKKHKGKAIGITMTGTGIGALILPQATSYIVEVYGWRTAYQAIGVGALVLSLPLVIALFKPNTQAQNDTAEQNSQPSWGMTRAEAMKQKQFWILGAVLFITVFVVVGLLSNFKPILLSKNLDGSTIAQVASIMGLTIIFGRMAAGFLVDKFWAPAVGALFFTMPIIAILLLVYVPSSAVVALIIALTVGLAAGAELDLLAYLTSKYFGSKHYPSVFGCVFAFFTVSAGIAPPIFGGVANKFGYDTILMISAGLLVLSIFLFLSLGKYPEQEALQE
ncbi:MFS transporter [Colwellia sp. RE-S-Sl-9]